MKAEYTIKIGDVFYKAGQEIPDFLGETKEKKDSEIKENKAVPVSAEPPVSAEEQPVKVTQPTKRSNSRRK